MLPPPRQSGDCLHNGQGGTSGARVRLPAVLLPTSREQIKKLGERLACGEPISEDDLQALEELVACHLAALELARPRLNDLAASLAIPPVHITHRPKTTQTIIEKLRRHGDMSLARMQDLAGIRIVGPFSFADQDRIVAEIAQRFPADPRTPKIIDRRVNPSHGYRAVHVVVTLDGVTIEVQVRTLMQHVWADLMERLADRLGRQIRYGQPPSPPPGMTQQQAEGIVNAMLEVSEQWAASDEPVFHDGMALSVDQVTDHMWSTVSGALQRSGLDL
jgi:ppGpp synthetase/RelA/SpoT-type nucleotidyltranferase